MINERATIRRADVGDESAVRACAVEAYTPYVAAIGRNPAPMVAEFGVQIRHGIVYVHPDHSVESAIAGFIVFYPRDEHMHLENVAVSNRCRGRGIGGRLIAHCEQQAIQLGLVAVELYTNELMTDNLCLYPHLGYEQIDRRQEDGFSRVFYRKVLKSVGHL